MTSTSECAPRLGGATFLVPSAALDAVAAGILLHHPWGYEAGIAAVLRVAAALFAVSAPAPSSRRYFALAAVLAVPCVGAAVAAVVLGTRGRGLARAEQRRRRFERSSPGAVATRRLANALPTCDLLAHGDEEERRRALASLARRSDPEATALLRWATSTRDPDLGLSAALALDEIAARAERDLARRPPATELRHVAG